MNKSILKPFCPRCVSVQNVVERVTSLPLVSSTCDLVSTVYSSTKDTHPYIRTVCEAAEVGVRNITSAVFTTASPIIGKLEPQSTKPLQSDYCDYGLPDEVDVA